jgi:ABC-type multidrug transport system fused ATPase/permease subunit
MNDLELADSTHPPPEPSRTGFSEVGCCCCGPIGSGKSTILNLLPRFYDPTGGIITLDEHDLRQVRRESLRKQFALVQQETFLFNDSILDNIRYGLPEATMEQVVSAAMQGNRE